MSSFRRQGLSSRIPRIMQQISAAVQRFFHKEATSGIVLLIAAAAALLLANSPLHEIYAALWHTPLSIASGPYPVSGDLHFGVNDMLMSLFFLVAGMEIRREIYDGALSGWKQAALPLIAALGGVCFPAIIYVLFNADAARHSGWAIPTATDIAFAVGILALLGKSIPGNVRIVLLSLAVIDDVIAVLIIAVFYSNGVDPSGLLVAVCGIGLVFLMQRLGLGSAWAYIIPGVVLWFGFLKAGIHPSLCGVVLGLLTPVSCARDTRDATAPVIRVQKALHPWVSFGVMPLFAFANAGIRFCDVSFSANGAAFVLSGVTLGLMVGKPAGVLLASYMAVKAGICRLPAHVSWGGMVLVGMLAGIGFTMAIFVAMLAFDGAAYLPVAKTGVLLGSAVSGIVGLAYGLFYVRHLNKGKA